MTKSTKSEQLEMDFIDPNETMLTGSGGYDSLGSITIDTSSYNFTSSITSPCVITYNTSTYSPTWTTTGGYYTNSPSVQINTDGIEVKDGGDIKIGRKSLTAAIDKIEERLGILRPNPELEDRWEQLKALRQQYMELEKDLLEKEKIMEILKKE